jgi:hypothetical protein
MSAYEGSTSVGARPGRLRRPPGEAKSQAGDPHRGIVLARRHAPALLALLVLLACAAAALLDLGTRPVAARRTHAPLAQHGLLSLPGALQGAASQTLGAQDPAYRVTPAPGGLRVNNQAQGLSAAFGSAGVTVSSGKLDLGLRLARAGYAGASQTVASVTPTGRSNRVTYERGSIQEWYANGPAGLEQGFTITRGPTHGARGPLELSLAISGGAGATALPRGRGIRFSGRHASLVYGAPTALDARGQSLKSRLQLRGGQLSLVVDTRNAAYPVRIDPFIQQGSKIVAGEIGKGQLGEAVALSSDGNTALVGAPSDNGGVGAVWVFTRSGGVWSQQGQKLTGGEETGKGQFGSAVALSEDGDTALIGGWFDNGQVGAAWVFTRAGAKWSQQGKKLTGGGESGAGRFGVSVALDSEADTALIGGYHDNTGTGAAWVFTRSGETWSQQGAKLTGAEEKGEGVFGTAVALSSDGNTALVSGYRDNGLVGAAWVFTRSKETWSQQGKKLTGGGEEVGGGGFGISVALSSDGNTALIGGYWDNTFVGAAWVFTRSGETWSQQGKKLTGGEETGQGYFGIGVAVSADGNTALIGGYNDNSEVGAAWVFTRSGETWSQQGAKITGAEEVGKGKFGTAVALSSDGNTGLIGGEGDDAEAGAAWAFTREAGKWSQQGEKLTGLVEREAGQFGIGTVMSGDGKTALIGARVDNKEHGAVWVFVRSGAEWVHQGKLTGGTEEKGFAEFGKALALSYDGNTALIGAQTDEGEAGKEVFQQGAAWVFTRSGGKWKQQGKKLLAPKPSGHLFGSGVGLSADGNTAVIGTRENEPHVFVFTRSGETWTASATIPRPEAEKSASFGETVAISPDGQTVFVADFLDNKETGGIWVFVKHGGAWVQSGPKLTGAGAEGEQFGGSIALSGDGNTLLVSANGPFPGHTGRVYVLTRTGESWAPQGAPLVGSGVIPFVSSFGQGVALSADGNTALIGGQAEAGVGAIWEFRRTESTWKQVGEKVMASGVEGEAAFGGPIALSPDGTTALVAGSQDAAHVGAVWVFMESPSLASASANEVTSSSAKLTGTVNPQGEEVTECQFEYGTSTSYGSTASCSPASPGTGTSPVPVSASLGSLSQNTVYHFRLASSNGHGIQRTEDQTFTTLESSATGETPEATKPAKAEDGGLSVEGKGGTGAVTIGPYGSNIGGAGLIGHNGTYFQVYRSQGASFDEVQYKDCELGGAKALWWFNRETGWEPIPSSMAVYTETPTPCVTVTATEATVPSIAQLSDPRHVGGPELKGESGKCFEAKHGAYTSAGCGTAKVEKGKGKGKYAWYPTSVTSCFPMKHGAYKEQSGSECKTEVAKHKGSFEKGENTYSSEYTGTEPITLKAGGAALLSCTGSSSGAKEISAHESFETISYTGCTHGNEKCESGVTKGEIVTAELDSFITTKLNGSPAGEYLEVLAGKEEEGHGVNEEKPREGLFMSFSCESGAQYNVLGAAAGKLAGFTLNAMMTTSTVTFAAAQAQELVVETLGNPVKRQEGLLTASAKNAYGQGLEFGEVGELPQKETVSLLERLEGESTKKYFDSVPPAKVGQTIEYQLIVRNIFSVERAYSAPSVIDTATGAPGCGEFMPSQPERFSLAAGASKEYKCKRKLTAAGKYVDVAEVTGSEGFGTRSSTEAKVTVE